MYVMGSSLSSNNKSRCFVLRSVNFLVAQRALIDLRGAGVSTYDSTISYTSYMGSVGAETFLGVS
jgi:hypothetical protein